MCKHSECGVYSSLFLWWYSSMLWWTLYDAQSAMHFDLMIHALIMMTWCMLYDILLCTMMCTFYMHITCWWWWWVFDDDDSTYPTTLMYNLWWCSTLAKQKYFSDCEWQWMMCTSRFRDWYVTDLQVMQYGTECVSVSDRADLAVISAADSEIGLA